MIHKTGDANILMVLVFLLVGVLALTATYIIMTKGGAWLFDILGRKLLGWGEKTVNPNSVFTLASEASFTRLNKDIADLLKTDGNPVHSITPYTLGQYRLVGFNRDPKGTLNKACLSEALVKVRPEECKGKACLCLCKKEDSCQCKVYSDIDYIVTGKNQFRNEGKLIDEVKDPVSSGDVYCLNIKGAVNQDDIVKIIEPLDNWWRSNNVYIEKSLRDSSKFIFFSRIDDVKYTQRMIKECAGGVADLSKCGEIRSCLDYKIVDMGCDWRYTCENEVCLDVNGFRCWPRSNPLAEDSDPNKELCVDEGTEVDNTCLPGDPGESAGVYGRSGDLHWVEEKGICMQCFGLLTVTAPGIDKWGWIQVTEYDKAHCPIGTYVP